MIRWLYSLGFAVCLPIILLRLFWRSRHNQAYRQRLAERFALRRIQQPQQGIWVHAVSMGECMAITPLVKAIQARYPDLPVTMTAMTITGSDYIQRTFAQTVYHYYIPYDFYWMQRRLLRAISPRLVILVETELWPNLLAACHTQKVPVLLANGRLSARSARGYGLIAPIIRRMLRSIDKLAVQEPAHKTRFEQLGALKSAVEVTGSIKFDVTLPDATLVQAHALRQQLGTDRPVWIAASTHEGEEQTLLTIHQQLLKQFPTALLILVPRHPERFDKVMQYIKRAGLHMLQYSQRQNWMPKILTTEHVILGDVMGKLLQLYASADVAFVGGSLIKHGGHNPLEPALVGCPIVVGPSMYNFSQITTQLINCNGLQQVQHSEQLQQVISQWFAAPDVAKSVGAKAHCFVEQNRGALDKHLALVATLLNDNKEEQHASRIAS